MNIHVGLSYGAYPQKVSESIGCSLEEAEEIFNAYHNEMFPKISEFKEKILNYVEEHNYTHIGLGCRLYSSNTNKHSRTLFNSNSQFWSILTLLTINKIHTLIDEEGYTEDIKCISTIYDSIYYLVKEDSKIIKWLNDKLIPTMCRDYLEDQIVSNTSSCEIGKDWSNLIKISNNASIEEIKEKLKGLK